VEARRNILTFLSLTVALCLPFYYRILSPKSIETIPDLVVAGIMWAPGVAALSLDSCIKGTSAGSDGDWDHHDI
jgi:hypothetical protein